MEGIDSLMSQMMKGTETRLRLYSTSQVTLREFSERTYHSLQDLNKLKIQKEQTIMQAARINRMRQQALPKQHHNLAIKVKHRRAALQSKVLQRQAEFSPLLLDRIREEVNAGP